MPVSKRRTVVPAFVSFCFISAMLEKKSMLSSAVAVTVSVLPARVTEAIRAGCCFAPFHWNDEQGADLAINATTSEAVDAISKQPEFKFCAVRLARVVVVAGRDGEGTDGGELEGEPFSAEQKAYLQAFFAGALDGR